MPEPAPIPVREARTLRELSPQQWRSGIAAWLGWLFDGLDIHLYTLVAAPFVAQLLLNSGDISALNPADPLVKEKSSWIQGAFLVGWALGGGFFGRIGDRLGRSRALGLTILTYALFTGLASFAQTWWQLLICRFLAALGIGGEWAVGSALLAETWPKQWRPWIAAVLQSAVNIGVLLACGTVYLFVTISSVLNVAYQPRWVFLVGILPALVVFWIRRKVPEPETWHAAKLAAHGDEPGVADLFARGIRRTTFLTLIVCGASLTAWWAFMFWHAQHLRNLPELAAWPVDQREKLVSVAFFLVIGVSIFGNFFCGWLARLIGYRRSISALCFFCSSVFSLFTMYMPPLFPTLLRTTGAGFCYNFGRIAAAVGTVVFGLFAPVGDFRHALLYAGYLMPLAGFVALLLPEPPDESGPVAALD
ncbi:MAG: MFS transporter [Kiritimatiellaeota bacterium]|nr:MFS transporter [Kiritimatiellota bacterium]